MQYNKFDELSSFLSNIPTYHFIGDSSNICDSCKEVCFEHDIHIHIISPKDLIMQGYKMGIISCSKELCLKKFIKAQQYNFMSYEQMINRIGNAKFYFLDCNDTSNQMGTPEEINTWQFCSCTRTKNDEHRVILYMVDLNGIMQRMIGLFLNDLLELNPLVIDCSY